MSNAKEEKRKPNDEALSNLVSMEDEWEPKGRCGLSNMGNTCYMNAAIQSLSNCTPLAQFFLKCDTFIKPSASIRTSVSDDYCKLMKVIWGVKRKRYTAPIELSRSVRAVYAQFRGYSQQDSQEFLRCLMDRLHLELKRPIMDFPLKQNQMQFKKDFIKHESKKLLGGNGSSGFDHYTSVENEPDSDFNEGSHDQSEKQSTNEKSSLSYHSIISDVFNGRLKSFVQCLACSGLSTTIENFQDLSLPIPGKEDLYHIHSQRSPHSLSNSSDSYGKGMLRNMYNWAGSWFIGPQVSLQDCLAAFFAKDELKGDNMYNCERCNKLRNGVKFLKVLSLPEVLSIHLKRFRHDMNYSSKISSSVSFPVNGLNLKPFVDKDCDSKFSTYDLCAVITHFGNVGGGHYIAYAKNCINNKWYEFNDSMVSEVSEYNVANAEAYVLFYNKRFSMEQKFRTHMREKMTKLSNSPTFCGVYISREWLIRFDTCVEPGQISNCDFLCRHGDVPPTLMPEVSNFVVFIPTSVWNTLHSRFGGGPEVSTLSECKICRELQHRREYELKTFNKLNDEFQRDSDPELSYCLSMAWYKKWNAFTKEEELEPPGAIDNSSIMEMKGNSLILIEDSSYGFISLDTWKFLHSRYGGGPEWVIRKSRSATPDNESKQEKMDLTS